MTPISDEELAEWRSQDLTRRAFALIKEARERYNEMGCCGDTADTSHAMAYERHGAIHALDFVLSLGAQDDSKGGSG